MKDTFKYLTTGEDDNIWGLYLNVTGSSNILPHSAYPPQNHPSGYYFNYREGRILQEYQINYITEGSGIFENKYGRFAVKTGSILFIYPGMWHRYKPNEKTGWKENYIGFSGKIANIMITENYFPVDTPVINLGIREELLDTYLKIFDLVEKEQPGFQQIASGLVIKLLGYIFSLQKQKGFSGKQIAGVIEKIRFYMRQNVEKDINLEELAKSHHVGYSYFRKMFKKYTGISPGQYHLQLRLIRAKELLISTDQSIKEISYSLGFQSIFYFSNLFKKKEGISPLQYRNKSRNV